SMLVSTALRGAGPPNRASSACSPAVSSAGRGAPGAGGTRLKSGGTTSGACRCTANSSGRSRPPMPPVLPQAASIALAPARRTRVADLRPRDEVISALRGAGRRLVFGCCLLVAHEEGTGKDYQDADGDRGIGDVEDQER